MSRARPGGEDAADWTARFAALSDLSPAARADLLAAARIVAAPAGTVVFGPGRTPENLLLLLEGRVRVQQTGENGREVFLYRVHAGESCVLTTACLLAAEPYAAEAVTETDIRAALLPQGAFDALVARSPEFRRFVFAGYARRIAELFAVIEEIAFRRVDMRLAQKLLALAGPDGTVDSTHQILALELGTAREVVSRQLQEFLRRGWVELSRGRIRLLRPAELRRLSGGER